MTELSRYLQHLGVSALPSQNEDTPLVLPIGATLENGGVQMRPALTRVAVHAIVKEVFARAAFDCANAMPRPRPRGHARKSIGSLAAAFWISHTRSKIDLRLVRDNFGHQSLATTSLYPHLDDDRRHQETDEKHRIDWQDFTALNVVFLTIHPAAIGRRANKRGA
jgi:integrase/recombinase XerD